MSEICSKCGLPKELCVCETIAKEDQRIKVYLDQKKFHKNYTIIEGINEKDIPIWILKKVEDWGKKMTSVFKELRRVLLPGGYVAFEVGEVRNGRLKLEEQVIPAAEAAGLIPILVLINSQKFTKTSNCWGVNNLSKGTNTNRVVILKKRP